MDDGVQFPVAEMAGEEQDALALRVREPCAILPIELDATHHRVERQRAELQQLEQQTAEMHERLACDRAQLPRRASWKRRGEVALSNAAVGAVQQIEREPQQDSGAA